MTPQLQQAIRLLQLSTLELQQEIQEALESNIMLESATEDTATVDTAESALRAEQPLQLNNETLPKELPVDSQWSDTYDSESSEQFYPNRSVVNRDDGAYDRLAGLAAPTTLHDYLNWQLNLARLSDRDLAIATVLIDAIDANGYLRLDLDELPAILNDPSVEQDEIMAVLHRVQMFEPPGVGARDLHECLVLQLRQLVATTPAAQQPTLALAQQLCDTQFQQLARPDLEALCHVTAATKPQVRAALALIRSLNPRPGALVSAQRFEYIIPDVLVRKREGRWQVALNPEIIARLRINDRYAAQCQVKRAERTEQTAVLKTHLQEAKWLIKSLESRNDTVLRVADKIVELQQGFFDYGEEAMRPLVLRDVANDLDLHESTVSRVTTQKFMDTPRGIFEFKFFFSSHVNTISGGECSSTAIRALIRKLVAAELPTNPLSDQKIVKILAEQGIEVARRTVAKYREALGIPSSTERKRLT